MENQHRKIKGYRELSQTEIDLMNEIKSKGVELGELIEKVHAHLGASLRSIEDKASIAQSEETLAEVERFRGSEPLRWTAIAKTDFQTGLMALTRAIAQPGFF